MKLHLPKNILATVLVAMSATSAYAVDYEVGTVTGGNNLPSASKNYKVYQGDITLGTGDRMGTFKNGELVKDAGFGKEEWATKSSIGKTLVQKTSGMLPRTCRLRALLL